jgi:hypothetical protein
MTVVEPKQPEDPEEARVPSTIKDTQRKQLIQEK